MRTASPWSSCLCPPPSRFQMPPPQSGPCIMAFGDFSCLSCHPLDAEFVAIGEIHMGCEGEKGIRHGRDLCVCLLCSRKVQILRKNMGETRDRENAVGLHNLAKAELEFNCRNGFQAWTPLGLHCAVL